MSTFIVHDSGDRAVEAPNGGNDTVLSYANGFTLGAAVETLRFIGSGNFIGTGNGGDNLIVGGGGADVLNGGGGNDTIEGGAGTDVMNGGPATTRSSLSRTSAPTRSTASPPTRPAARICSTFPGSASPPGTSRKA